MKLYSSSGKYSKNPKASPQRQAAAQPAIQTESRGATPAPVPVASAMTPEQIAALKQRRINAMKRRKAKVRRRRTILGAVAIFLVIMLATFAFFAIRKSKAANDFRKLIEEIQQIEEQMAGVPDDDDTLPTEPAPEDSDVDAETMPEESTPPAKTILDKYAPLYLENSEFYAWIKIPDTRIDYPVMRSFEDNDEYLRANFNGEYSYCGIPFADINCSHDSDNILIYGHNMKDGTMFRDLVKYEKESFWKKHPTIIFSDLYEDYEYEVVAAFYDRVYKKSDKVFKFYQFVDAQDEDEFNYAVSQFKKKSLYDTGVNAAYGDKLITLITCAYHVDNGRFVVVARRK